MNPFLLADMIDLVYLVVKRFASMLEYLEDNIVQAVKSTVDLPNIRELTGQQTLYHALELTQQLLTDFHLIHLTWRLLKPTIQQDNFEQGINSWIKFTDGALP